MAWRFKASKYKNAAPIVPKPETCIRDICVGSYQTYGNNIAASAAFIAFNWEHAGSSLAVLPIDDCGRKSKTMPLLHAHSDTVTYLDFSPFHDGLLATGSQDCLVKVWHIPEKGLESSISNPECTFSTKQRRVETVGFHPTADCLLYSTAVGCVTLWDLTSQQESFSNNQHPEVIQSLSWKQDGALCATSCKDKMVRILDPRAETPIMMIAESHQSIKDSRVVWLGDQNRILTTGFDAARLRQVLIRDLRNFSTPEKTLELDCSTGILMPLYDPDTNMLFLAGKGDTTITYLEVTDKDPYLIEGIRHSGEQTKGACLVPKRALRVMEGEVNRIMQLTSNSVIPIMYQVPRKTYRDFHGDLYPDTVGFKTELTSTQWLNGVNMAVPKISLDPAKRELGEQPIIILRGNLTEVVKNIANKSKNVAKTDSCTAAKIDKEAIVKPAFVPIKDKIKQMEQQSISEKSEFEQKFKEVMSSKDNKNAENANTIIDPTKACYEHESNGNHPNQTSQDDDGSVEESDQPGEMTPPKPMPRTSRNNSVSEQLSGAGDEIQVVPAPRPIARPRTTSTGYKPRLGPKPFCSTGSSSDFSFDKVFNVPQAPGSENGDSLKDSNDNTQENSLASNGSSEEAHENGNCKDQDGDGVEEVMLRHKASDEEDNQRIISTAERRKIFESKLSTESEDQFDAGPDDKVNQFERLSGQRTSIAERRRMYENRSQSVQEEKPASPVPLRRRESLKVRGEQKTDEEAMPPPASVEFIRNRSDLCKDNIPSDISKRGGGGGNSNNSSTTTTSKRTSTVFGRVSKFRHLKGTPGHKSTHIENIRNLSRQIPGECDGFQANPERAAVPIAGAGGKIAIFELSKPGRLPDGVIPSLVNGNNIMDFQWDPFDNKRLAVACDDGTVKIWAIPEGGLTEPTNEPEKELFAHSDKIYIIRYHPLAKNVFLTASYDMTLKIWDLDTLAEKYCLKGHTDQIFSFAWSPCGTYGATVSKDGKIRVYNPRKSENPIREGNGPVGTRGARLVWAIEGDYIVVTGFDKVSERQIYVYKSTDLNAPLGMVGLDVSPAILIPFYDEDSSTIFATGKGDSTIYCFEITEESPFICPLSHHRCSSLTQGLTFFPKNQCDVASVEFAKAQRLTNGTIEPLSFTVPRIKSELFQDDLFPPTKVLWEPTLSAAEWFNGKDKPVARVSLQPEGMDTLSSIQPNVAAQTPAKKGGDNINQIIGQQTQFNKAWSADLVRSKQDEIKNSVSSRMPVNRKLEQDDMEGVDEKEWEE
ncbi:coronin-7 isoform X2 [Toxorhynchites rutilus septentrionalis]|uniref:coronin-7 isoform X2 n=1 Tax=Toxorhynchites rutilus septentrionalis TaxID=329112 RepID=UPI002479AC00|nr:coronin-7 isoform X2 [Toxorhynchites rutilus septentrionalis]